MCVRSIYGTVTVPNGPPGYNTIFTKTYYPALNPTQAFGPFPANPSGAPFPVVVFMSGADVIAESYQWLALRLVLHGLLVLTYDYVTPSGNGTTMLTPGYNPAFLSTPSVPASTALPPLFDYLDMLNKTTPLTGLVDSKTIILGGHSLGGRVALDSVTNGYFSRVKGVFTYGVHSAVPVALGYKPGSVLPLNTSLPVLLMAGTQDGIIKRAGPLYGVNWTEPYTPVELTFDDALKGGLDNQYLFVIKGANHFAIAFPVDNTSSSAWADLPSKIPGQDARDLISDATNNFIQGAILNKNQQQNDLESWLDHPPEHTLIFERK